MAGKSISEMMYIAYIVSIEM